jgi:hypothetical protein
MPEGLFDHLGLPVLDEGDDFEFGPAPRTATRF